MISAGSSSKLWFMCTLHPSPTCSLALFFWEYPIPSNCELCGRREAEGGDPTFDSGIHSQSVLPNLSPVCLGPLQETQLHCAWSLRVCGTNRRIALAATGTLWAPGTKGGVTIKETELKIRKRVTGACEKPRQGLTHSSRVNKWLTLFLSSARQSWSFSLN